MPADGHSGAAMGLTRHRRSFLTGEESEAQGFSSPHGVAAGGGSGLHLVT